MQKRNSILTLLSIVFGFFAVAVLAIPRFFGAILGRPQKPIAENRFLDSLNFLAHTGPKSFWKKPTGLKIGRSIATFLHYIFAREETYVPSGGEKMKSPRDNKGFTLIEMIVSMTIFAIILVAAFASLGTISTSRVQVNDNLDLNKDVYFAVEKFAALVKEWGTIDYEEYWNRKNVGTTTASGHYRDFSSYGNSGSVVRCDNGNPMVVGSWCTTPGQQKYGNYPLQFINFADPNIQDDDEDLGLGPAALDSSVAQKELYLIKKNTLPNERLFFRLNVKKDPGNAIACDGTPTNSGCISNLQMLKLTGKDTDNNGKTDTWNCAKNYCATPGNPPTSVDDGWVDVFPDYINVKGVKFFVSPDKDAKLAWKDASVISPYVRVQLDLGFSASRRAKRQGADPTITISTTINLE